MPWSSLRGGSGPSRRRRRVDANIKRLARIRLELGIGERLVPPFRNARRTASEGLEGYPAVTM